MKTNTFFIYTPDREMIGMLCINFDLSLPLMTKNWLDSFLGELSTGSCSKQTGSSNIESRSAAPDPDREDMFKSLSKDIIGDVIRQHGTPVKRMTPGERIAVLKELKSKGVFRIKYAVREVARGLEISEPSVYRYLKELKDEWG